jgi:hypothetical protein
VKHKKIAIAYHTLSLLIEEKEKKDKKTRGETTKLKKKVFVLCFLTFV